MFCCLWVLAVALLFTFGVDWLFRLVVFVWDTGWVGCVYIGDAGV